MKNNLVDTYSTFDGFHLIGSGSLLSNALVAKKAFAASAAGPILTFDDRTGRAVDLDTRGSEAEIAARLEAGKNAGSAHASTDRGQAEPESAADPSPAAPEPARGRGRPKLGVVAREVTLLPRHWDWLGTQPGGASVALRKLVEAARKTHADQDRVRLAQERAYHFMLAIAGNLPGYEEATRALFANDQPKLRSLIAAWPPDIRDHAIKLAFDPISSAAT
jgi:hypothetical protein